MKKQLIYTALIASSMIFVGTAATAQQSQIHEVAAAASDESTTPAQDTKRKKKKKEKKRQPPPQATNNIGDRDGSKVICKKSRSTGTRLRERKVCKTRAQWELERSNTRDGINEFKSQTRVDQYQ